MLVYLPLFLTPPWVVHVRESCADDERIMLGIRLIPSLQIRFMANLYVGARNSNSVVIAQAEWRNDVCSISM